jgi:hypothetical protein
MRVYTACNSVVAREYGTQHGGELVMINGLRRLWPSTLREQMVAVLVPLLLLACGTLGYVLTHIGEEAILGEKGSSLQGVNRTQLLRLNALGGFDGLEARAQAGHTASPLVDQDAVLLTKQLGWRA